MDRRNLKIIYVFLLCVLFLSLLCVLFPNVSCQNKGKKEDIYAIRVGDLSDVILTQSSACLSQAKAYTAVWEYAKVTGEDFDTAARHILGSARAEAKGSFAHNKMMIQDFLKKVEDPPEKYRSSHEKLLEMYDLYIKLNDLAVKPNAPQEEYEASVYKLYDQLLKKGAELNTLLGR
jgi:hypothetical protein